MSGARLILCVLVISAATALSVLDGTIANVALPTIARVFEVDSATSIWVINAYQLTVVMTLLAAASLGEIFGYRHIFRAGIGIFVLGSLCCSIASSFEGLVMARMVQGSGAAGIMAVGSALIRSAYPSRLLGRGIGINAMVVTVSAATGPALAGLMLSFIPWQWLFAINIPIGLITLIGSMAALPVDPGEERSFDLLGALLNAAAIGSLIGGIESLAHNATPALPVCLLVLSVVSGTAAVRWQRARPAPILPFDLLSIPIFSLSLAASTVGFIAQMLVLVSLPFYLQHDVGLSALQTGLLMTPWPLAAAMTAPLAGFLSDRFRPVLVGSAGLSLAFVGFVALVLLPRQLEATILILPVMCCGLGFGLFQTPNTRTIIAVTPRERSGGAGGMIGTSRLVGQTIGTALTAYILATASSFSGVTGAKLAMGCASAFLVAAALLSGSRLRLR